MIINDKLKKELITLKHTITSVTDNSSISDVQLENFLQILEKARYNVLHEVKLYNKSLDFEYEKIKTIDSDYSAELVNDVLKIYVPEVIPSYRNLKTHNSKRILLNIAEITKPFAEQFDTEVFIYVKVFDNILGWDIDNKYIKPIADGLILSRVIKDDNMTKMFYCAKGEYSENPHTEIYVLNGENFNQFLESYSC